MRGGNIESLAAIQQTRMLAHTLSQNSDPKFQSSKFLQFVSKMSRGELIIDDNQVKPASENWATEYQQQYNGGASWADEFVHDEVFRGPDHWANEFGAERLQQESVDDQWVNEFSKLHVDDWAEEFGRQVGEGALGDSSSDNWANSYDEFLNEQLAAKQRSDASRGVYVFSDMNPYVGHQNPLKEGQELFRKGLLSEAVLALEAEIMKNPENAEGWRLLGITHAENDDDQQVGEQSSTCKIVVNGLREGWKTEEPNLVGFLKQLHLTNPLILTFSGSPRNPQIVSFLELLDLPYVFDNASDSRDSPPSLPQKDDYSEDIPNEDKDDLEDDAERM